MNYSIYYGELSQKRKDDWDNGEENPFSVLEKKRRIKCMDWVAFLGAARKCFYDEVQIDWGSFAWKAKKKDLLKIKEAMCVEIEDENELEDNKEYGLVFIEMS